VRTEGLSALSMREVARRAGVSHQAPYHHFADREAILAALCEEGFAQLLSEFRAAVEGVEGPVERLRETGRAYVRWALGHSAHFRIMFRPELVSLERFPDARGVAQEAFGFLVDRVGELVEAGVVPADQAEVVTMLVWSTVHGLATLLLDGPLPARGSDLEAEQAADRVIERMAMLLKGRRSARRSGPRS
jgi:AcrR family transcriptional regulator